MRDLWPKLATCVVTQADNLLFDGPVQLAWIRGFSFDNHLEKSGVVTQVAFVDAQEKHAVALSDKVAAAAHEDEIIVVIADNGDQTPGRLIPHQLVPVGNVGQTIRSGEAVIAE